MTIAASFPMKAPGGETIDVPSVGYGTWAAGDNNWCEEATLAALKAGYRHLDCAWKYGVDEQVGEAIRESGVPRGDIFITSKFWPHFMAPDNVSTCLDHVLKDTGLEYVDLFLAHWPVAFKPHGDLASARAGHGVSKEEQGIATDPDTGKEVLDLEHSAANIAAAAGVKGSFVPTWRAMQALVRTGKVRAVGVSNFSIPQLQEILSASSSDDVPLSCNQIEAHPWFPNTELITFMQQHGVLPTMYSPFAGQKEDGKTLTGDSTVKEIAKRNGVGEGQCLQSWAVMRGTIPLGKSQNPERIKANLSVKELSKEDFDAISALKFPGDTGRTIDYSDAWGAKLYV